MHARFFSFAVSLPSLRDGGRARLEASRTSEITNTDDKASQPCTALYVEPLLGIVAGLSLMLLAAVLFIVWLIRGMLGFHYPTALLGLDRDGLLELFLTTAQRCGDRVAPEVNCALPGAAILAAGGLGLILLNLIAAAAVFIYLTWLRRSSARKA